MYNYYECVCSCLIITCMCDSLSLSLFLSLSLSLSLSPSLSLSAWLYQHPSPWQAASPHRHWYVLQWSHQKWVKTLSAKKHILPSNSTTHNMYYGTVLLLSTYMYIWMEALVQFGCYQHRYEWKGLWCSSTVPATINTDISAYVKAPIIIMISLELSCTCTCTCTCTLFFFSFCFCFSPWACVSFGGPPEGQHESQCHQGALLSHRHLDQASHPGRVLQFHLCPPCKC